MDRRALIVIAAAAASLSGTVASAAQAASTDPSALLARADAGTLTADGIAANGATGSLSDTAKPAGARRPSATVADPAVSAGDRLPMTGSDPRITLLLGFAALLGGAGLRLRARDARDF